MAVWRTSFILILCALGGNVNCQERKKYNFSADNVLDSRDHSSDGYGSIYTTTGKLRTVILNLFDHPLEESASSNRVKRRSSSSSAGVQGQSPVSLYYAYPSGSMPGLVALPTASPAATISVPGAATRVFEMGGEKYYTEAEKEALLQNALDSAWEQYGPKTKPRIQVQGQTHPLTSSYTHRDTSGTYAYNPNNGFQPWESEWDTHVMALPPPGRPAMEPSFFNRLMASYIDFEVNNHELADFLRRAVAVGFIALVIAGWIGLGIYLGLFPLKWLYFLGVGRDRDGTSSERDVHANGKMGNDLMSEITDRIFLALDGDWLRKLEERVSTDENRNWLKTHVQCCILPDAKAKGMVDCQLVRKGKKDSAFKCLTDLIYNFQFNPTAPPPGTPPKKNKTKSKSKDVVSTENSRDRNSREKSENL